MRRVKPPGENQNYMDLIFVPKDGIHFSVSKEGMVTVDMENTGFYNRLAQKLFHRPKTSHIALDAYRRDPLSSFFLIGAADSRDRKSATTRRFRVYTTYVNNLNLTHLFRIIELKDQSMIVLLNRKSVPDTDAYMQRILDFVV